MCDKNQRVAMIGLIALTGLAIIICAACFVMRGSEPSQIGGAIMAGFTGIAAIWQVNKLKDEPSSPPAVPPTPDTPEKPAEDK